MKFYIVELNNALNNCTLKNETFTMVRSFYDNTHSELISGTQRADTLPDLEYLHPHYKLSTYLLPEDSSESYPISIPHYIAMLKAIRIFLLKTEVIEEGCIKLTTTRHENSSEYCGFRLFLELFGSIFPNLGVQEINIVQDV